MSMVSHTLMAQETEESENQVWLDFIPHARISNTLEYYGTVGYRSIWGDQRSRVVTFRPSLRFQFLPALALHGGVAFFYSFHEGIDDNLEIRPWEGLRLSWPDVYMLRFKQYLRLEQRININMTDGSKTYAHRIRYRIKAKLPLNKRSIQYQTFYVPFYYETFATLDEASDVVYSSRNRFMVGLGYVFGERWIAEVEYISQSDRFSPEGGYLDANNILRLKVQRSGWIFGE